MALVFHPVSDHRLDPEYHRRLACPSDPEYQSDLAYPEYRSVLACHPVSDHPSDLGYPGFHRWWGYPSDLEYLGYRSGLGYRGFRWPLGFLMVLGILLGRNPGE